MFTLTLSLSTLDELLDVLKRLSGNSFTPSGVVAPKGVVTNGVLSETNMPESKPPKSPKPAKAKKEAGPLEVPPTEEAKEEPETAETTYDEVKNAVLAVARRDREASLDLLAPFGVVSGEGEKRTGSITKLKPEQYAAVVEAAKKLLAS